MISFWCTALNRPWSWQWIAYPGVWIVALLPVVLYARAVRANPAPFDRRRAGQFAAGILVFWMASDWPLGTLGAGYLASAHMVQFILYSLVVTPLLLMGTPEWMARRILERLHLRRVALRMGKSLVWSGALYNLILVVTHAPPTVDSLLQNQVGSFLMDMSWLLAGVILWWPVLAPLPEARASSTWAKMVYLFVTTSVVAVVPASFLTFATTPIYATYELAPRIGAMTAREDQQIAGIIMKLATVPLIWGTIAGLWFRMAQREAVSDPS